MSTPEERLRIAKSILSFEARRDKKGRLAVYKLPKGDGGGTFEVAGINDGNHPEQARALANLIAAGKFDQAEQQAIVFMVAFTDAVVTWSSITAVESYLRDCCFNRGPKGAARILQRALGLHDDGAIGNDTRTAMAAAEADPRALLKKMRAAREQYERDVAHRNERSKFWKGLVNRWNNALTFALTFLPADAPVVAQAPAQGAAAQHG